MVTRAAPSGWQSVEAPLGWRKGHFDSRFVFCPREKKVTFIATKNSDISLPRETKGRRWTVWTCRCGEKRTIVAWKNGRGRRLYTLSDLDWAKKHAGCK